MKRVCITHGELIFIPISKFGGGKTVKTKSYIAGHSETGHHHILDSKVEFEVLEGENQREVLLKEVGKLWHKKDYEVHETRELAPGAWKILYKTEYNPFEKVVSRIYD